jgi:hypothetical protein
MPSGCSKPQQLVPGSPTPNTSRNRGCLGGGWGGFPRRFDTCIYIWKEASTEPGTLLPCPALPSPAGDAYIVPFCFPWGGRGGGTRGARYRFGRGGKEIFIFEPLCLFCLRLKEGKIMCVSCLGFWGLPGKEPWRVADLLLPSLPQLLGKWERYCFPL